MFMKKFSKFRFSEDEWPTKWRLAKRTINGVSRNYKSAILKKRLKNSLHLPMIQVQIRYDRMFSDVLVFSHMKFKKF
jgi:hypothetical protein